MDTDLKKIEENVKGLLDRDQVTAYFLKKADQEYNLSNFWLGISAIYMAGCVITGALDLVGVIVIDNSSYIVLGFIFLVIMGAYRSSYVEYLKFMTLMSIRYSSFVEESITGVNPLGKGVPALVDIGEDDGCKHDKKSLDE